MLIAMLLSDLSIQKLLMLISMLTCATSIWGRNFPIDRERFFGS
jgi:hypothetical protein